jgi:hypothetical protein
LHRSISALPADANERGRSPRSPKLIREQVISISFRDVLSAFLGSLVVLAVVWGWRRYYRRAWGLAVGMN